MLSELQAALADAIIELKSATGSQTFTRLSDSRSFVPVPGSFKFERIELLGGQDREFPMTLLPGDEPSPPLRTGDELTFNGSNFRVIRRDYDFATGLVSVVVSPS